MKILFLNYEYPPLGGGAGNATKYLLDTYKEIDHLTVDLVTSTINNQAYTDHLGGNVSIHYVSIGKNAKTLTYQSTKDLMIYSAKGYREAKKLCKKNHYDVIHAFFGVPCGSMAQRLSKKFHIPYIVSLRGADVPGFSDRYNQLYPLLIPHIKSVWRDASVVIANSTILKNLAHVTAPKQEIDVIYNGVDTSVFTLSPQRRQAKNDPFVVLVSARLMRRKGIRFAIDAFSAFKNQYSQVKIKMIIAGGDGDASVNLKQQVQHYSLGDSILFTGHLTQKELIIAYKRAHVFLLPSLNEGMSNNILEALSCGLPIITTRTGGAGIIEHKKHGFLVKRKNAESITDALIQLLENPEKAIQMGISNRTLAESMRWKDIAIQYEQLYYNHYKK